MSNLESTKKFDKTFEFDTTAAKSQPINKENDEIFLIDEELK